MLFVIFLRFSSISISSSEMGIARIDVLFFGGTDFRVEVLYLLYVLIIFSSKLHPPKLKQ